jgi:hypothetical protein
MINSVRDTVLSILNKNNYGYLNPSDFNRFAKIAQLDIFKDYFYKLNYQINKENIRQSGTMLANLSQQIRERIEPFIVHPIDLSQDVDNVYFAPSQSTTGSDYFSILNIMCYDTSVSPKRYVAEADKADPVQLQAIRESLLQGASKTFPLYQLTGNQIRIYPDSFNTAGALECQYIRMPKDPKWTFRILQGGTAVYDPTQPDFQDFEINQDDEVELVVKICQYAGVMIRESEVVQFTKGEEVYQAQSEQ